MSQFFTTLLEILFIGSKIRTRVRKEMKKRIADGERKFKAEMVEISKEYEHSIKLAEDKRTNSEQDAADKIVKSIIG